MRALRIAVILISGMLHCAIIAGIVFLILDYRANPSDMPFQLWLVPIGGSAFLSGMISWAVTSRSARRQSDTRGIAGAWGALAGLIALLSTLVTSTLLCFALMISASPAMIAGFAVVTLAGPLLAPRIVLYFRGRRQHAGAPSPKPNPLAVASLVMAVFGGVCAIFTIPIAILTTLIPNLPDGFIFLPLALSISALGFGAAAVYKIRLESLTGGRGIANFSMGLAILQIILLTSIAWSDFDGRNKVTIVHIPDGRVAYKFRVRVSKVDFSPDGKYLGALTSSMELNGPEAIRLWRAGDGRSVDKFPCGGRRFDSIAFSRDGKILAAAGDGISVLNIAENKPDQAISPPEQADERYYGSRIIGFTPEGRLFTSDESHDPSTNRTRIVIWNTANSSAVGQLDLKWRKVPDRNCSYQPGICLSPDGALIAGVRTSSDDWEKPDNAYVWGASNGRLVCKIPRDKSSGLGTHLAFSPDSKMLAVADKSVKIWSIPDASLRSELGKVSGGDNTEMQSVGFSKDGKRLAAASMHQVQVWNVSNGMPLYTYSLERGNLSDNIEYASISPDGQFIAILSSRGN